MEAEFRLPLKYEDASTNPAHHKDRVRYASGLWLSRTPEPQLSNELHSLHMNDKKLSLKRRSKRNSPDYSPWKRRKIHHESSPVKKSEHRHSTTAHWPPVPPAASSSASNSASNNEVDPMVATLTAAGRDMAVSMMKKRKSGLAGRMYDVPQIGKFFIFCNSRRIIDRSQLEVVLY